MKQHVGGAEQVGKLLLLDPADAVGDGLSILGAGFLGELSFEVVDGGGEEAAGAAGGVEDDLALVQPGIDHLHHELGDSTRGVELAGVPGAAQVVEDLLVDVAELAAALDVVEVDGLVELLDDTQHQGAGLHVVVGVDEDLADDLGPRIVLDGEILEPRERRCC